MLLATVLVLAGCGRQMTLDELRTHFEQIQRPEGAILIDSRETKEGDALHPPQLDHTYRMSESASASAAADAWAQAFDAASYTSMISGSADGGYGVYSLNYRDSTSTISVRCSKTPDITCSVLVGKSA